MSLDIQPGSMVGVTVTRSPSNEAAAKTLSRLFAKDPANRKARRERKKLLNHVLRITRRGGRPWEVRAKAPRLFKPEQGDRCNLLATLDVIGDLGSVRRFIEVKAAK